MTIPRVNVNPPLRRITRAGTLLGSVPIVSGADPANDQVESGDAWANGFTFPAEPCHPDHTTYVDTDGGCPTITALTADAATTRVTGKVWLVRAGVKCANRGSLTDDHTARATRLLGTIEGPTAGFRTWEHIRSLAAADVTTQLTPVSGALASPAPFALGALQARLSECCGDEQGIIHAPIQVVTLWVQQCLVRYDNGLLRDYFDNIIVADRGYAGTGPNGEVPTSTRMWAYVTNMVEIRRTSIETLEAYDAGAGSATDAQNSWLAIAQRYYGLALDGRCVGAIRVDTCSVLCVE